MHLTFYEIQTNTQNYTYKHSCMHDVSNRHAFRAATLLLRLLLRT
jgi:hypothetical protein